MSDFEYRTWFKCSNKQFRYEKMPCEECESQDLEDQDCPRCPKCFRRQDDWNEDFANCNDGGESSITCGHCEEEFKARINVSYSFDTLAKVEAKP